MKSNYYEKKAARIERYQELARKNEERAESLYNTSTKMSEAIPMGQPILVGHHSEKRDRNFRDKIWNKMGQSVEAQKKAAYYKGKSFAADSNDSISSDAPDAKELIQQRIEELEQRQERMKKFNTLMRKNDIEGMKALGYTDSQISDKLHPRFGSPGYAHFELTNNNANIRRLKKRLEQLEKVSQLEYKEEQHETTIGTIKIVLNTDENRVQILFPGKPSEAVRTKLKSYGFRWSPSESAWQRQISRWAWDGAQQIVNELKAQTP